MHMWGRGHRSRMFSQTPLGRGSLDFSLPPTLFGCGPPQGERRAATDVIHRWQPHPRLFEGGGSDALRTFHTSAATPKELRSLQMVALGSDQGSSSTKAVFRGVGFANKLSTVGSVRPVVGSLRWSSCCPGGTLRGLGAMRRRGGPPSRRGAGAGGPLQRGLRQGATKRRPCRCAPCGCTRPTCCCSSAPKMAHGG